MSEILDYEIKRINLTVPIELLERIDDFAYIKKIDRIDAIKYLLTTCLDMVYVTGKVSDLKKGVKKNKS